jgi:peptidoglycan/xylan/chitin deacetylase (PgdA/CDA1 family)
VTSIRRRSITPSSTTTPSRFDASKAAARTLARSAVLSTVGSRSTIAPSIHLLAGHDTGPPGRSDPDAFRRLLAQLGREADLVRVEDAVAAIRRGDEVDRPMLAFTFDDGFLDCHQHLAPALEEVGINAAFFVNSRYIGAGPAYIEHFNRTAVCNFGRLPMTGEMVRDLAERGFVIGAHTGDHIRLDTADPAVLTDQIVRCRQEVEELTARPCPWFAWPFGTYADFSPQAAAVAFDTYEVVFSSADHTRYTSHGGRILNRRHFEVYWPASHVRYHLRTPRRHEAG